MKSTTLHRIFLLPLLLSGCATTTLPLVPIPVPIPRISFLGGEDLDYSRRDWPDAGRKLVARMREEYAYTELKGIDWDSLGAELQQRTESAESAGDQAAYYAALRSFTESLRDANVDLSPDTALLKNVCGAGFGLELAQLDDGRVLVSKLYPDGAAAQAGVPSLAEVLAWDGAPITESVSKAPLLWAGSAPATNHARQLARLTRIVRAPEGSTAKLTLRVAGEPDREVTLTARKQPWSALDGDGLLSSLDVETGAVLDSRDLGDRIGYIDVHRFSPTLTAPFPGRAFRVALESAITSGARGLIVDLRSTTGGLDEFAAEFAGYLMVESGVYRDLAVFEKESKSYVVDEELRINYTGQPTPVNLPVLLLVNEETSGPAEMLAWTLQRAGRARVAGESPTKGAAPVPDRTVELPGGYRIIYPLARWIAPDGSTPVETDATGKGGVTPDLKAPVTEETLRARRGGADPLLDFAKAALLSESVTPTP